MELFPNYIIKGLLLCCLLGFVQQASAQAGPPFLCDGEMYLAQSSGGSNTALYHINTSTNPFTYDQIGVVASLKYNAMDLREADGYIYALKNASNHLLKISADGTYIDMGAVTDLPVAPSLVPYNSGAMDDADNFYVLNTSGTTTTNKMYNIDIVTQTATPITLTSNINPSDIVYNPSDGLLYGVNNGGRLLSIDPTTGTVTLIGTATGGQPFGAMMGSSTGQFYGVSNGGGFYQFNITDGTRLKLSNSPTSTGNEGAHCVTATITFEADLSVTITDGVVSYTPGNTVTYTVVVTNNGPFGVMDAQVANAVPAGIPAANVSYTAVASSGSTTAVTGTQTGAIADVVSLPPGGTVTYTVTVDIPISHTGDLVNEAAVTLPVNATDPNLANNTASDTNIKYCSIPVQGTAFSWAYGGSNPPAPSNPVTQNITQPAANGGFVFDIYTLDNSFNMNINGTPLATQEIEFQSSGTSGINIRFQDGDEYENHAGTIWQMNGDAQHPLIRVKINASGAVTMYGSKTSGGPLFPLELFNGNSFNSISWNANSSNNITITQNVVGETTMDGYGYGLNIVDCDPVYTITKEGVFNDENSDSYAQVGETITYTIEVDNNGNNAAYNMVVNDPLFGGDITASPIGDSNNDGILDVPETWVYTLTHTVTQADIDNGGIYNQATATGGNGVGDTFNSIESIDPTPLSSGDPNYDPARPDYTFVFLKIPLKPVLVNPQLRNPAKGN